MSLIDKIKQKLREIIDTKELVQEKKLKLSELEAFVKSHIKDIIIRDKKSAIQISQNIISELNEIAKTADSLRDMEPYAKGNFPDQIISAGRSSKDFFCRQVEIIATKITKPDEDYKSFNEFRKKILKAIIQLNLDPKKAELFMLCFEKEVKLIRNRLSEIKKQADSLSNLLNKKSILFKSDELQVESNKTINIENELKEISKISSKLSDKLKKLEKAQQEINKKIEKLSTTKADKLNAEISSVQQSKKELLNKLSNEFTSLRKALKKYQHGEPESTKGELEGYIENFAETILVDSELKILKIVSEIKTAILENKILLDLKSRDKVLTLIRLLTKDYIENIQKQYAELVEKLNKLEQQKNELLMPIRNKRIELEKQQRELNAQITELAKEIKTKTRYIENKDKELFQSKSELEKIASDLTNIKIEVRKLFKFSST
jgi:hypothetical protein